MWRSTILLLVFGVITHAQLDMTSDKMDFEDNIAEESQQSDEEIFASAVTAKPILNDGKPFYVARDPATGTLDFNIKKTVGITNDIPVSHKDELAGGSKPGHDINSLGVNNFHDFLNLPVKYSSSKFVYPLITGSYANLKFQGNNKNHNSNHKNYTTTMGTSTQLPKYFTHISNLASEEFTATFKHPEPTKADTVRTTRPSTTHPTATERTTTTQMATPETSTVKYSSTIVQNSFPSTFKNKYVDSSETRKKTTMATTTTKQPETSTLPANPVKFFDDLIKRVEHSETKATTYRPHFDSTRLSFETSMPLLPSAFKPMPKEQPRNQTHKIQFESAPKNPSIMSLSEIINSFAGKDGLSNEQNSIAYEGADSSPIEIKKLPSSTFADVAQKQAPVNQHKTLQQQMQFQQSTKPQLVDLPVRQQSQFTPPVSHVGFPNDQFEDYVEFENPQDAQYANQYVKYEVQKPNVNLIKFQQAPSAMNNVVISPGQNSASFVLGSQQNVGSIGIGSSLGVGTGQSGNRPMKVGQVINDHPPMRTVQNPSQIQASIRFPTDAGNGFENAPIVKGIIRDGSSEAVQPPQALSQQPLVFPSSNEQKMTSDMMNAEVSIVSSSPVGPNPSQIIFENVNDIYDKIHDKNQKHDISSNELSPNGIAAGELTPPQVLVPPSPTQLRPFNRLQQMHLHQQQQQQQNFNILHQKQQPIQNMRKPGPQRLNIPGLPNILPQFRPNSKSSQGHPQIYKEIGSIRVPVQNAYRQNMGPISLQKAGLPNLKRMPNPQYFTRSYGPNRQNFNSNHRNNQEPPPNPDISPNLESANRRVFNAPPPQVNDRTFMQPPPLPPPGFQLKRPYAGQPETMQMQQRPTNIPQPSDSKLNKSSPPGLQNFPTNPAEIEDNLQNTRLEPVITLQMLQNKKVGSNKLNLPPVPHDIPQDILSPSPSNHKDDGSKKSSVYVVYPVTTNSYENSAPFMNSNSYEDPSVVLAHREDALMPKISEYQNTPFSVVSHFEQEPLLMKKDKKKNPFPYHLERPYQSTEYKFEHLKYGQSQDGSIYNTGETPTNARVVNKRPPLMGEHPDSAISSKLTRVTEKPIAIAYTPTEPNRNYPPVTNFYNNLHPHHHYSHQSDEKFSVPNYDGPVISEILDEKNTNFDYYHRQQALQQHLNNGEDLDFYREHYEFQAPFQASVNVPSGTNPSKRPSNPYEGWAIVTQSTDANKIDRADLHVSESSEETSTRKFDPNEFQPVFESGFQPIYSAGKVSTVPELFPESSEVPSTLAITYSTQPITTTTHSSTTSSIETSEEPKSREELTTSKVEKKKQKLEIDSLEAFFESLTRDYDEDESTNKSENENSSKSL